MNVTQRRIATGSVAAAILIGGAVVAANVSSPAPAEVASSSTVEVSASPSAVPRATASPAPATAGPTAASASPTPRQTSKAASRSGTRSATVLWSGSCGASFYDEPQMTANGETFDPDALTAASKTLAFDTRVRVTSMDTGRSVVVRINDRGPYIDGRCLDLSRAAFDAIDDLDKGAVTVRYEILK